MIYSMTAFARGQSHSDDGSLTCEIRSINHRYLEISLYLPEVLRALEPSIRECIRKHVKRGKIECNLRYQPNRDEETSAFTVNKGLVLALSQAHKTIAECVQSRAPIYPADILRFPGVLETKEANLTDLEGAVLLCLEKTLNDLIEARKREGEELKQLLLKRMNLIQGELEKIWEQLPKVLQGERERLLARFADAKLELDPMRLEQEMVIFAQKIDVSEELDRTKTHIAEVRRVLNEGGTIGRRLDFLLQELNREANTLASKSGDPLIIHAAVEMKVLIEEGREQVQNLE